MKAGVHAVGCQAAQQIQFIHTGSSDEQVRLFHTRASKHLHGCTVTLDRHHIIPLDCGLKRSGIVVNQGQIMSLTGQLSREHLTDFAVPGYNNSHTHLRRIQYFTQQFPYTRVILS